MVNAGCVARLLSNFHISTNQWVKTVNPGWYEKRELPKTVLIKKESLSLMTKVKSPRRLEIKNKRKFVQKMRFGKNPYHLRKSLK
ncbi:uncharacterized protein Dwil_GK27319 [Drosophila willistoni]|uniref:Uncharacterized protein n=1 Tax=Drosophila willistoni TaxID=7260 RepID=A0A0Q9X0W1_DROWI|nr:uncharacterized protein LOC26529321 [Drosophila willistoni]KRF97570.1 uncharacterized protein Dwil_GK27319 [Drosophila willistoni]